MRNITSTIRRTVLTLLALSLATSSGAAFAQAPSGSGQALEIGPPIVNLKGDPGQTLKAELSLRDITNEKLIVTNEINDFTANGEDGTPKLLLNEESASANSIVSWITPLPQFTLVPRQIQKLDLTLKIPANAPPGGYYGIIRFTGRPPDINKSGVSLSASIGALVFIRVNGQAKESMSVEEFSVAGENGKTNWLFESPPVNFVERIKNSGNLFEKPTGLVTVTDMFGKTLGAVNINDGAGQVLPDTTRRFTQLFGETTYGNRFLFGKYTAQLVVKYGDDNQQVTSTVTYWIIPYRLIAAIIIALIVLGLLIRYGLQRYRENILRNTRGGRRR